MNEDQLEAYKERAAIMEYDGGLTRQEAENMAAALVLSAHKKAQAPAPIPEKTANRKTNPELEKIKRQLNGQ